MLDVLEQYFIPTSNESVNRHVFNTRNQLEDEPIDSVINKSPSELMFGRKGRNGICFKDLIHNMTSAKVVGPSQRPRNYRLRLLIILDLYQASLYNHGSFDDDE